MATTLTMRLANFAHFLTSGSFLPAVDVTYDPTASGMTATNVQDAIDELEATGGGGVPAGTPVVMGPGHATGTGLPTPAIDLPADTVIVRVWLVTTVEQTTPTAGDLVNIGLQGDGGGSQIGLVAYDLFDGGSPPDATFYPEPYTRELTGIVHEHLAATVRVDAHLVVNLTNASGWEGDVYALVVLP